MLRVEPVSIRTMGGNRTTEIGDAGKLADEFSDGPEREVAHSDAFLRARPPTSRTAAPALVTGVS